MISWNNLIFSRCSLHTWIKLLIISCTVWSCHCKIFRIAWISPDKSSGREINSFTSVSALKLALATVMKNPVLLKGHSIEVDYFSTDCTPHMSKLAADKAKAVNPDVIIGPPCHEGMKMVAQRCATWNLPVFSWYNPGIEFDSTQTYPTLIRMIPSLSTMGKSLIHLLRQNKWTEFALVYEDIQPWTLYEEAVRAAVANTEVRMLSSHSVNSTVTDAYLVQMFNHIKKYSWIVVFACPTADIRRYLLAAEQAGMAFGNHVFIQLDHQLYSEKTIKSAVISKKRWMRGDAKDQIAKRAYQSLIHVMLDSMNDDAVPTYKLPRNRYAEFLRTAAGGSKIYDKKLPPGGQPDVYSLYLYDAVLMWSVLVEKLFTAGKNYHGGKLIAQEAKQFLADGASGFLAVNENLDRIGKLFILYMEADGTFKPSQILKFNSSNGYEVVNLKPLQEQLRYHGGQTKTPVSYVNAPAVATTAAATVSTTAATKLPTTKLALPYPTPNKSKPTVLTAEPAGKPSDHLINRLLAKVQALEKSIKEHETHSHQHIPHHNHPHPPVASLTTTPPNKLFTNSHGQHILGVGNILIGQAHVPDQLVPNTQNSQAHAAVDVANINFETGHLHWHPHPIHPEQGPGHPTPVSGSHAPTTTTHKPPPPRPPPIQTTPAPVRTTTLPPTTTVATTTTLPANNDMLNGPLDEATIHRISSRIVDHLTGTNTTNTNRRETQIVNELLSYGLDELPPALLLTIQAARDQRLLQQQNQELYNNINNQPHVQNKQNSQNPAQSQQVPVQNVQHSQNQAQPQQAPVQQWLPSNPVYQDPFDTLLWGAPFLW